MSSAPPAAVASGPVVFFISDCCRCAKLGDVERRGAAAGPALAGLFGLYRRHPLLGLEAAAARVQDSRSGSQGVVRRRESSALQEGCPACVPAAFGVRLSTR
ncbi:unnamed protein product [Nezara viridula]|uniref:Uncharacterized protein n=1 Tax=Nezara viridula TaxID=85310 RepID=A0A9P0MPR1_NEZVI|nr:unnamed protein product [Nezara viridula]